MKTFVREVRAVLVCFVAVLISAPFLEAQGQQRLRIVVIEGEDAVNVIQQKTAVAPVVEVRDRNNNPVAGTAVTFALKGGNAKATLANGVRQLVVTTDAAGRASVAVNPVANGAIEIEASVSSGGQTATATIAQTNVATPADAAKAMKGGGGHTGLIVTTAALGAGGVAGWKYYEKYQEEQTPEPTVDIGCAMSRVGNPISAPAQGGTYPITFTTTCKWFATVDPWMTVSPSSGEGSGAGLDINGGQQVTITLTVQPNATAARSGKLQLHNANYAPWGPFNIDVNQAAGAGAFTLPGRIVVASRTANCTAASAVEAMSIRLTEIGGAMQMTLSDCSGADAVSGPVSRSGDRVTAHLASSRGAVEFEGLIVGRELRATMNIAGVSTPIVLIEN
jgi:hypothetical protein